MRKTFHKDEVFDENDWKKRFFCFPPYFVTFLSWRYWSVLWTVVLFCSMIFLHSSRYQRSKLVAYMFWKLLNVFPAFSEAFSSLTFRRKAEITETFLVFTDKSSKVLPKYYKFTLKWIFGLASHGGLNFSKSEINGFQAMNSSVRLFFNFFRASRPF